MQICKTSFKDSYRKLPGATLRITMPLFGTNTRYNSYQIALFPLPIPGITKPCTFPLLIPETISTKSHSSRHYTWYNRVVHLFNTNTRDALIPNSTLLVTRYLVLRSYTSSPTPTPAPNSYQTDTIPGIAMPSPQNQNSRRTYCLV